MARTAAQLLVDRLGAWGVDTVFGLPGDGINGIMEALRQRRDGIRFIHVRHEESAAFAACAYAKLPVASASASPPRGRVPSTSSTAFSFSRWRRRPAPRFGDFPEDV